MTLRIATRGSPLARWQAEHVAGLLGEDVTLVVIETTGDRRQDVPIWEMGGRGVFVKAVQAARLDGRADVAVHSAKDLPSAPVPGLVIGAVPTREDARDALVGSRLDDIPTGAEVATGSVRRRAQLAAYRPDLTFAGLRGNIDTRLAKAGEFAAIVVAAAALIRLGKADRASEILAPDVMLPQVAQGALAVECRDDDDATMARLAGIEHGPSRAAVDAERAFLAELGGGCDLPVGALALAEGAGRLTLTGLRASLDGRIVLRHAATGRDGPALGRAVARHLLDDAGGAALLEDIR
ncbi:MAG: hydroxymethylbilane synthase, partial [Actinomycetota bacterium]|nr:hydroxymethylbilane synthase [Actinomycetota bacterium]